MRANQKPVLRGKNSILDPWEETVSDVLEIARLGYVYQETGAGAGVPI